MRKVTFYRMTWSCFLVFLGIGVVTIQPQRDSNILGEIDSVWPGIQVQLAKVERIPLNRLLVVVRLVATKQAPTKGTLIGNRPHIPDNTPKDELLSARYSPGPFSLATSR